MRRLLAALSMMFLPGLAFGATCTSQAATCSPGPCLASLAASWSCGHVPNLGTDSFNISTGHSMTLDTNLNVTQDDGDASCYDNTISGTLTSDGNGRTITITVDAVDNSCADLRIEAGTFELKGGDKMVCVGNSTINECLVEPVTGAAIGFLNSGTVGTEQTAGTVSAAGTTYTISGITTTGYAVGDILWWTGGNAQSFPYEITALTSTTVTYKTDLADSLSLDLHLTPDEGTLGGAPASLHTIPSIVPAAGDPFRLIKPVKWTYSGASGGSWRMSAGNATQHASSNFRFRGFSVISSARIPINAALNSIRIALPTTHSGEWTVQFANLGEHAFQDPYLFGGFQGKAFDYIYCHDSLPDATSTGACFGLPACSVGTCGVDHPTQNVFVGHFHGTRTTSQPFQVGVVGGTQDPSGIVLWEPVVHDGGNESASESNGMELAECTNCLVYRPRCWNIHDPDGSGGYCYYLDGLSTGSVIADGFAVNTGTGIALDGTWTALNMYISNTRDAGIAAITSGSNSKVVSSVVNKWGLDTSSETAIMNADIEGAILLGGTSQATAFAWTVDADRSSAITLRNIIAKGYRGDEAFKIPAAVDQNVTLQHVTCGGPSTGSAGCYDMALAVAAVTLTVDDIAVDSCGTSAVAGICAAVGTPTDNVGKIARDTDTCTAPTGVCASGPTNVTATDLKFVAPSSNNYNVTDATSVLWRTGLQPAGSFIGARCIGFDPSRLPSGLTIDAAVVNVMTESCHDGDRDGWMTFIEGTNTPDSCAAVTDLRNAATCTNGETAPGKRVFP